MRIISFMVFLESEGLVVVNDDIVEKFWFLLDVGLDKDFIFCV